MSEFGFIGCVMLHSLLFSISNSNIMYQLCIKYYVSTMFLSTVLCIGDLLVKKVPILH